MREGTNKEQEDFRDVDPGVGQGWLEANASLVSFLPSEQRCLEGFCSANVIPSTMC